MREPEHPVPPVGGARPAPDPGAVPWRAREGIVIALISFATGVVAYALAAAFVEGDVLEAVAVLASEAALGLAVAVWLRGRHGVGIRALGLRWEGRRGAARGVGAGILALGLAYVVVTPIAVSLFESFSGERFVAPQQLDLDQPSAAVLALTGVAVVLVAPLVEEMFFRGFVYRAVRRWAEPLPAGLVSAAVFAAVHVQSPWLESLAVIVPAIFVLGLILARLVERRGSIASAVVAHVTFNAVGYAVIVASL